MEASQLAALGVSTVAVSLSLLTLFANRNDKSADKYAMVLEKLGETNLQIANLRTELAEREMRQHLEMQRAFVARNEFDAQSKLVDFTLRLTKEVHRRMYPDAAINQPGAKDG